MIELSIVGGSSAQPTVITVGENCPQNRTVITVCVRFDCVKCSGEHEAGDESDDDDDNRVTYACERSHLYDIKPTNHKLGRLWTWDRWDRRPVYKVLAVKDVHETRAIMPYWQKDTAKWSIGTGVYENKFLMDDRTRPPFITRCPCLGPAP